MRIQIKVISPIIKTMSYFLTRCCIPSWSAVSFGSKCLPKLTVVIFPNAQVPSIPKCPVFNTFCLSFLYPQMEEFIIVSKLYMHSFKWTNTICIHSNEQKIKYPDDSDMIKNVDLSKFLCLTVNFSFEGTYLKLSIFHSEEILELFFFRYGFYI